MSARRSKLVRSAIAFLLAGVLAAIAGYSGITERNVQTLRGLCIVFLLISGALFATHFLASKESG